MQKLILVALGMLSCAAGSEIVTVPGHPYPCVQLGPCYVGYKHHLHGRKCCKPCDPYGSTTDEITILDVCDDTHCCTCDAESGGFHCEPCVDGLPPSEADAKKCTKSYEPCNFLDLVFVLDCSGSVDESTEWPLVLDFAVRMADELEIGPDQVRIGLVTFSDSANPVFTLAELQDKDHIKQRLADTDYCGGGTDIGGAITVAATQVFNQNGDRPNAPDVMIVVTDGQSDKDDAQDAADDARANGIEIVGVGVGNGVDENLLECISSSGMSLLVEDFPDLEKFVMELIEMACDVA